MKLNEIEITDKSYSEQKAEIFTSRKKLEAFYSFCQSSFKSSLIDSKEPQKIVLKLLLQKGTEFFISPQQNVSESRYIISSFQDNHEKKDYHIEEIKRNVFLEAIKEEKIREIDNNMLDKHIKTYLGIKDYDKLKQNFDSFNEIIKSKIKPDMLDIFELFKLFKNDYKYLDHFWNYGYLKIMLHAYPLQIPKKIPEEQKLLDDFKKRLGIKLIDFDPPLELLEEEDENKARIRRVNETLFKHAEYYQMILSFLKNEKNKESQECVTISLMRKDAVKDFKSDPKRSMDCPQISNRLQKLLGKVGENITKKIKLNISRGMTKIGIATGGKNKKRTRKKKKNKRKTIKYS